MDLATLLERTWTGVTYFVRPQTAPVLFLQAERYRQEGRYDEAAELVALGLAEVPDSRLGHLLNAYLHTARRQIEPARLAFCQVLTYDPHHPRALLGLARLYIEEGDLEGASGLLDEALSFYPDFPEALALRELLDTWPAGEPVVAPAVGADDLDRCDGLRDVMVTRADGTLLTETGDNERATDTARHMSRVARMSAAVLLRAQLGPLQHGVVRTDTDTVVMASEIGLVISAVLSGGQTDSATGLAELERLGDRFASQVGPR